MLSKHNSALNSPVAVAFYSFVLVFSPLQLLSSGQRQFLFRKRTKNQNPRSVHLPASVVDSEFLPACVRQEQMAAQPGQTSAACQELIRHQTPRDRAGRAQAN